MSRRDPRASFKERLSGWAARLDLQMSAVSIRKMRLKWASCSAAGRLTFDESVLGLSAELQDYVIVHELLHIEVPNHGKLWKSLMRVHLGDYEGLERRLKRETHYRTRDFERGIARNP